MSDYSYEGFAVGPHSEALVGVVGHAGDIVDQQGIVEEEDGVAVWGGLMNLVDADVYKRQVLVSTKTHSLTGAISPAR